jgi:hypothetical protein
MRAQRLRRRRLAGAGYGLVCVAAVVVPQLLPLAARRVTMWLCLAGAAWCFGQLLGEGLAVAAGMGWRWLQRAASSNEGPKPEPRHLAAPRRQRPLQELGPPHRAHPRPEDDLA